MDQIKTYQKKDSFLKLENQNQKQEYETTVLVTKILQILENDKLLKLLNETELEIINKIKTDLRKKDKGINSDTYRLKKNTIAEINSFNHETEIIN